MALRAPSASQIRTAKINAVGGMRKRCTKGKSCSATCIAGNEDCLVELPEPISNAIQKARDNLAQGGMTTSKTELAQKKLMRRLQEEEAARQAAAPSEPLTGQALLDKVKEMGGASKSDLARATGYVTTEEDGSERLNFTGFYEALLATQAVKSDEDSKLTATKSWEEARAQNPSLVKRDKKMWEEFEDAIRERYSWDKETEKLGEEIIKDTKKLEGREREIEMSKQAMYNDARTTLRRYTSTPETLYSGEDDEDGLPYVGSSEINGRLRTAKKMGRDWRENEFGDEDDLTTAIDNMDMAFVHLYTQNSARLPHFRGMNLTPQEYQQFSRLSPGDTFSDPGYSSYSSSKKIAKDFYGSRPEDGSLSRKVLLVSKNPNLRDITAFSDHPGEKESLLDRGEAQRVDWVRETVNGKQRTLVIGVDYD